MSIYIKQLTTKSFVLQGSKSARAYVKNELLHTKHLHISYIIVNSSKYMQTFNFPFFQIPLASHNNLYTSWHVQHDEH